MTSTITLVASSLIFFSCHFAWSTSQPSAGSTSQDKNSARQIFTGICDASAAVAIDDHRFLVAEDEIDILRLYRNGPGTQVAMQSFDLSQQLRDNPNRECDIEGAARVGDRVFWISSHGRNKDGKRRPNRSRFFATDIKVTPDSIALTWVGRYDYLVRDLLDPQRWDEPGAIATTTVVAALTQAAKPSTKKTARLAPKQKGLNIEALAARPDGSGLLVGFRNPAPAGKAIVVQLRNASALVSQMQITARFGRVYLLDLHGLGLRSMAWSAKHKAFLIIAGPAGGGGPFKVFRWRPAESLVMLKQLRVVRDSSPEALVVYPGEGRLQILHDEGTMLIDSIKCKDLAENQRRFTGTWLQLPR